MSQATLEFIFRRQHGLKDLIDLISEKAKMLSVMPAKETSKGSIYSLTQKKYQGNIQLSEPNDGVITGRLIEGDMILEAFVDWVGRNGRDIVYGLDIQFRNKGDSKIYEYSYKGSR